MKNNILFFLIVFVVNGISFSQEKVINDNEILLEAISLNWNATFKKALKKSKKEKKPVLIYFTGSDWCGPCKVLDKNLFHTEKFKAIADNDLILYEADFPRNKNLVAPDKSEVNYDLKRKYKISSYPALVFVNHRGKMIDVKKGLILTEYYYPFIQSVIDNY